jgi:hypothetical protein
VRRGVKTLAQFKGDKMNKDDILKLVDEKLSECEYKCDGPHIVVLDKGWMFHGNLIPPDKSCDEYRLTSCVNIRYFKKVGFGGLTKGAKSAEAILDPCETITFKESTLIFKVATKDNWRNS